MGNVFLEYMVDREGKSKSSSKNKSSQGPVITISREYGCPARKIGEQIGDILNNKLEQKGKKSGWKCISKEIMENSARELRLSPELTKDLSKYKKQGFFENMALFFSEDFYPGDTKIKNTVAKVVHNAAEEGRVIIVGRAGEAITKHFKQSIHIKLVAPVEWRSEILSEKLEISIPEAKREAIEMDERRLAFREYFERGVPDVQFYDATFNCKEMLDEEIVDVIIALVEKRGIL